MSILEVIDLKKDSSQGSFIENLSFSIEEKGVYAFLGKASSGKSTLAQILAGVTEADSGIVFFRESDMYANAKKNKIAKAKIGYVPENIFFYPDMTAFEVLDFTGRIKKVDPDKRFRQIKEAFELLALSEKSDVLVKDLTLSEKKRLAVANAIIGNPSMLILDDPTSRASAEDAEIIRNAIAMLGKFKPVLLFTDKAIEAEALATNICILSNGKIALWETLDEIKAKFNNEKGALLKTYEAFSNSYARKGGR